VDGDGISEHEDLIALGRLAASLTALYGLDGECRSEVKKGARKEMKKEAKKEG